MILLFLACAGPPADSAAEPEPELPWSEPNQPGPWAVGALTLEYTDARGKDMTAEVWYPVDPDILEAGAEPDPYPPTSLAGLAHREVPAATLGAPWPKVAFSHGFGAIRYQSIYLTEHLASHGFVVVAPDHPGNTMFDFSEDDVVRVLIERPDDIRFAVDELILQSEGGHEILGGLVEDGPYGMTGHSFGAFTTMVVAGGEVDYSGVAERCAEDGAGGAVCDYIEGVGEEGIVLEGTVDARAVAAAPLSPGVWYAFGADGAGLASLQAPLVLGGDKDPLLDYDDEIRPCYEHAAAPKRLATFADAGHYAFSDICRIAPFLTEECTTEGWADIETAQRISATLVTAHFGVEILGEARFAPWLEQDLADVGGMVTIETE